MPNAGSTGSRTTAFGSRAATSSISMPPDFEAITIGRARDRSRVMPRYSSRSVCSASSTSTLRTTRPSGPVCGVTSVIPRIAFACWNACAASCATRIPPPFPRPPAWIWALTTTGPPICCATSRAAVGLSATSPRGTATPYFARIDFAWYSWTFTFRIPPSGEGGAAESAVLRGSPTPSDRQDAEQLAHRIRRPAKRRLLVGRELDLHDLLDTLASELDRNAQVDAGHPVLPLEIRRAGEDLLLVLQDRLDHFRDRGRGRVVGRPRLVVVHDFDSAVPRALDDRVDPLLRDELRARDARDGRGPRQRHHGGSMAAEDEGVGALDGNVELLREEPAHPGGVEDSRHPEH